MSTHDSNRRLLGWAVVVSLGLTLAITGSQGSAASHNSGSVPTPPPDPPAAVSPGADIVGVPVTGAVGITESVDSIMNRVRAAGLWSRTLILDQEEPLVRPFIPAEDPGAPLLASWPPAAAELESFLEPLAPQAPGVSFKAVGTVGGESPYIPPDSMGDVGPTQVLVHVNGRIKVFDKTGVLGPLNADDVTFWSSVAAGQGTSDPEVRYDRLSGRWFVGIINVAATNNLVLLAVSSGPTITGQSSFTFYSFPISVGGSGEDTNFCDYPGFGIDANAIYVGCNMFNGALVFQHTTGYVIRKSSVLGGGPIVVTPFPNISGGVTAGPWAPRGVDNDDPQATEGYFAGVDIAVFSRLVLRRVTNPGGTPSISGNLNLTVPSTSTPLLQVASGSTTSLDTSDDRLFMASIHKNKITGASTLWTAHSIAVTTACVGATTGNTRRNGGRWYELTNLTTTPSLVQSGTLCDTAATNPRGYIYPTVAESGQGHMALGATVAASNMLAGVASAGRFRTDTLGVIQAPAVIQSGLGSYTVVGNGRNRWGDYSFTDVDPNDDMTFWTVQEYADTPNNNWAVRVVQLLAPVPAAPASASPATVCPGVASTSVAITGTSILGSGFFDPGPDTGGPGFTNHIGASINHGVSVGGVTFTDPTHVTLNVNTVGATSGAANVTVTNPDGQSSTGVGILTVFNNAAPAASNSGPVCAGGTIQLTASTIPGATYSWTGPNGFASSLQNPTVPGVGAASAGTYQVIATVSGCATLAGTTSVSVIADGGSCSDGNACTQTDTCQAGVCAGSNSVTCTALDQCHDAGTCDTQTGACSNPNKADGSACSDGNACTQTDTCQAGVCAGSNPVTCTALDQCHDAGTCDTQTGVCSNPNKANGSACSDGNACTQTDTCEAGICTGANPIVCTALDQCHDPGTCDTQTGACSNPDKANGSACSDGNACTQSDTCEAGVCTGANPIVCTALDQCHDAGTCDSGTGACSNPDKADGTSCSDGDACTQTDTCAAGVCAGANPVTCTAADQCHLPGACDPQSGICSSPPAPDGTTCDDTNTCTAGETCSGGLCAGGTPVTPAAVNDTVLLTDDGVTTTISWTDPPGDYSVYRGVATDGTPWSYNQVCLAPHTGAATATDTDEPGVGSVFFYLVTRVDVCGESAPGRDSNEVPNPNPAPCP
jgi:hypothetical protein